MKITDKLVQKFGVDKLLHFSIGAWITALGGIYNYMGCLCCGVIVIMLNIIKERLLDEQPDPKDTLFTLFGSIVSIIACFGINTIKQLLLN